MTERVFIPGSPWLYFKIYTGPKSADDILESYLYPLVTELMEKGIIDDFFFIRYSDPQFHLRIRFLIRDSSHYGEIFQSFYRHFHPCVEKGIISKIQCDTYQRELERYGHSSMELAERIFGADSLYMLKLLRQLSEGEQNKEVERWELSLRLVDDLLEAFGLNLDRKIELLTLMAENFKKEFGFTRNTFTKQLNDKYRELRQQVTNSFQKTEETENILLQRKKDLADIAGEILKMEAENKLEIPLDNLLYSLSHMTMNRWFRSKNRLYEMVIYDFQLRHYKSVKARTKNT